MSLLIVAPLHVVKVYDILTIKGDLQNNVLCSPGTSSAQLLSRGRLFCNLWTVQETPGFVMWDSLSLQVPDHSLFATLKSSPLICTHVSYYSGVFILDIICWLADMIILKSLPKIAWQWTEKKNEFSLQSSTTYSSQLPTHLTLSSFCDAADCHIAQANIKQFKIIFSFCFTFTFTFPLRLLCGLSMF
jgi:hypothetical protein